MNQEKTFGSIVKEHRQLLGLTQTELGRRVGCAPITIRKVEADILRPSIQIAEHLAVALNIPEEQHPAFVRLGRTEREAPPLPTPQPILEEIGQADLTGRTIRGFELGERIGAGGYGVVYRAVQATVGREVAIKIILPQFADRPEFIRRFEAEAQLVARLEHPHIVPLYDYWREPGVAYLVMRLLRSGSLETLLQAGPLAYSTILSVLEQICAGLQAAHRAGVIHRDLKPANILLDEDGNAYLADFGIAKQIDSGSRAEMTLEGTVLGSPAYISPEQILAEPVKPQTDIYSMGVVLYELLTGRKPFKGPTPFAYIQQHLNEPLPLLAEVQEGDFSTPTSEPAPSTPSVRRPRAISSTGQPIPTALDIVIGRATANEPRDRYHDILSLLTDLRHALAPGATAADMTAYQTLAKEAPHVATMIELPNLENPYRGLRPFTEADVANFFGRETLIQDLLARLTESNDLARFLAVVGPSGSGKSSVVRAGLIPALRQGGLPGSENWFITEMLPGRHPFEELEAALLRIAINPPESLLTQLHDGERGLLRAVRRILPADDSIELVLVIDQFEELFTLVEDEETRAHFLNSLVTAILDPDSRLWLVITLRADFTDQPLRYVDVGELVRQRTEFVLPLTPDELEQAIVGPTQRAGLSLEPGLVQTIIREIGDQPGMLPLLQYALTELFERRQGRTLTLAAYQESGGVKGALARRAEELYTGLDEAGQEMTRQLFLRLVTLGEGTEDTRRRVLRAELEALTAEDTTADDRVRSLPVGPPTAEDAADELSAVGGQWSAVINEVIDLFGRYHLLTFDRDPITRGPTVEVAHEAMLREWGRLREWLAFSRTDIRMQRLLATAAAEWQATNQDASFLLRGTRLDQFAGWAESTTLALTPEERAFLEASLADRQTRRAEEETRQRRELETAQKLAETEAHRATEQARAARRLRWLAVGLAVFLLAAIGAAWFASNQSNIAQNNFVTAERIRLASQAQIALDNGEGGDLPALLALRSLQYGYSPEADAALSMALKRGFPRQQFIGHTDWLRDARFSPDGRYILTTSADNTARLWDAETGQELRQFIGHTASVLVAVFSSDGYNVLTNGLDQTLRLWDVETGQELRRFNVHSPAVGAAFSPDGRYVAGADGAVARLWDAQTGQELRQFAGHTDTLAWMEFSPDGRYLSTSSNDQTARLWDVKTGQELRRFIGHTDFVSTTNFSPDSRHLLTASFDRTARLWDVETGQELHRFIGHTDFVYTAAFSPDGRYVVTSSGDKTARLWETATGQEIRQIIGHTGGVLGAVFSPDGQQVLTASQDRTARLWEVSLNTEPLTLSSYSASLDSMNVCAAGLFMLTSYGEGMVRTWKLETDGAADLMRETGFETKIINALNYSWDLDLPIGPPPRYIVTASGDSLARLWLYGTGQELRRFEGHTGPVWDVVFSTDDRYVLTGSEDHTARLWDAKTGQELHRFTGHSGPIYSVAFSFDGRYALTGSGDHTAKLWDIQTGQEVLLLAGHSGSVRDVAFSPEGAPFAPPDALPVGRPSKFILTGSTDGVARLWDRETGQQIRQFVGHTDQVARVAFSPDSRYVLTGSADQTARLWDIETGRLTREFVGHSSSLLFVGFSMYGDVLTADQRGVYAWRTTLEQIIEFSCAQLSRDFTAEERARYNISDIAPTCPKFQANNRG